MGEINKAEEIRKQYDTSGFLKNAEIIELLKKRGIEVSVQQVSNVKHHLLSTGKKRGNVEITVSILKKVKALADEIGGIGVLRAAINELEELL